MDIRSGLLGGGAVKDIVKVENKKFTLKVKKAAPRPTEAGNWKESDAKSTSLPLPRQPERKMLTQRRRRQQASSNGVTSREPSRREDACGLSDRPPLGRQGRHNTMQALPPADTPRGFRNTHPRLSE